MRFVFTLCLLLPVSVIAASVESFHHAAQRQSFSVTTVKKGGTTQYFSKKPWQGLFATKKFGRRDQVELNSIKRSLKASITDLPSFHTSALKSLEVRNQKHQSRGMANSRMMILNTDSIGSNQELQAVFTHEMGHIVDLGMLKTSGRLKSDYWSRGTQVFAGDPSIAFYDISWKSDIQRKVGAKRADFISGYAMTSPFEDFAESYLFYRLHGEKFREIAQDSAALQAKYSFMKHRVFKGEEYQLAKPDKGFLHNVIWDATLVKF